LRAAALWIDHRASERLGIEIFAAGAS